MIFATGNKGKIREAREILGIDIQSPADLGIFDDPEETGLTFQENSLIKAKAIFDRTGLDCFADDSGLEVDALGGAPGIYSARFMALDLEKWPPLKGVDVLKQGIPDHNFDANIERLLDELSKRPDAPRTARFRCVTTLMLNGIPHYFEGTCEGRIAYEKAGCGGFGYDPVFIPDKGQGAGEAKTIAELGEEVKNSISHRGEALRRMAEFLQASSQI